MNRIQSLLIVNMVSILSSNIIIIAKVPIINKAVCCRFKLHT